MMDYIVYCMEGRVWHNGLYCILYRGTSMLKWTILYTVQRDEYGVMDYIVQEDKYGIMDYIVYCIEGLVWYNGLYCVEGRVWYNGLYCILYRGTSMV